MDIKYIRENTDLVRENQKKRFKDHNIVDKILELDKKSIKNKFLEEKCKHLKNIVTKLIQDTIHDQSKPKQFSTDFMKNESTDFNSETIFNQCYDLLMDKKNDDVKTILETICNNGLGKDLSKLSKY